MQIDRRPQLKAEGDLRAICQEVVSERKSPMEWDRIESDDMFQRGPFVGGYEQPEQGFTFSYHDPAGKEWWFGFSLSIAEKIARGDEHWLDFFEPN